jgi:glycosyltransferase involved in cell wall biosynthesis
VRWHILTGEYPASGNRSDRGSTTPDHSTGGVADYTRLVAQGLVAAGDAVDVWVPAGRSDAADTVPLWDDEDVVVHGLPDHFGGRSLVNLTRSLRAERGPHRILVQYVPHAFGWRGANVPFCLWLSSRKRDAVWVMFHEVAYPISPRQRLLHNGLGVVTRGMASLVASAAERIFVSIPAWEPLVRPVASASTPLTWMPVPSTIGVHANPEATAAVRARWADGRPLVGHFGTFGALVAPLVLEAIPLVVDQTDANVLLLGRDSEVAAAALVNRASTLRARVHAAGPLSPQALSHHIAACDVMLQPYPDGVSSRRTSVMAALAHARPVVTTTGALTEDIWHEGGVILCPVGDAAALAATVAALLRTPSYTDRVRAAGRALYDSHFDLRHTIAALREAGAPPVGLRAAS